MDIWIDQQTKIAQLKEVIGGPSETKDRGTIPELVSALKDLQTMAQEGKVSGLPDWMSNPVEFIKTVQSITERGEAGGAPSWLSDPAEFIKTVRLISGEGKGDDAVKSELSELRRTLREMQEASHKQEMATLQAQIKAQADAHQKQMDEVLAKIEQSGKSVTGRSEFDIIHEVAAEGLGLIKTEAAGMRGMLKEVFSGAGLPARKTPQEMEGRKAGYRKALKADEDIEQLGRRLFFGES